MVEEIGSEFWTGCTPSIKKEYTMRPWVIYNQHNSRIIETLSGRTALEYIVECLIGKGKKRAYLPSYCCHTMIEPFLTHGMDVLFYDVQYGANGIHRDVRKEDYDAILLMDYFGYTDPETYAFAKRERIKGKSLIYDATHSMYSSIDTTPYDFVYASYRKWVDINCGFFAWKENLSHGEIVQNDNNQAYTSVREKLFNLKASFINGGAATKDDFLPLIEQSEIILEEQYHHKMPDKRSCEVLKKTDVSYIKMRRRENARVLTEAINELNDNRVCCINPVLNIADVPLFVPVIVSAGCRDLLRRHLIKNHIYCPVHWPLTDLHTNLPGSKQLFESELSLICDQRYGVKEMIRISELIKDYLCNN